MVGHREFFMVLYTRRSSVGRIENVYTGDRETYRTQRFDNDVGVLSGDFAGFLEKLVWNYT